MMRNLALTSHNAIYAETHRLDMLADAARDQAGALCRDYREPRRSPLARLRGVLEAMGTSRIRSGRRVGGLAQPVTPAAH